MPIYMYKKQDGSLIEIEQSMNDKPLTNHPETGERIDKVFIAPSIHFKGKGFHNTDYPKKKKIKTS